MILDLMADALTWILAVFVLLVGVSLTFIGLRAIPGFANPDHDWLAWYGNRTVTIFTMLNFKLVSAFGLIGVAVGGLGGVLYTFSWMSNKSGLTSLFVDDKLLNLMAFLPVDKLVIVGLLLALLPQGIVMAINSGRRGFTETKLAGYSSAVAAIWLLYFGLFDKNSDFSLAMSHPMSEPLWLEVVREKNERFIAVARMAMDGPLGFLGGAAIAVLGWAFVCMSGMWIFGVFAAIFNFLLVAVSSRTPLGFAFGLVGLGGAAFLAVHWAS